MKCSTCKHRTEIVNSHRISCQYFWQNKKMISESPLHKGSVPEYAKTSGWFNFPYDFDPLWVTDCGSHCTKTENEVLYDFI